MVGPFPFDASANPDGTKVVTSEFVVSNTPVDTAPILWELDPERWAELACEIAGRNLTRGRMGRLPARPRLPHHLRRVARRHVAGTAQRILRRTSLRGAAHAIRAQISAPNVRRSAGHGERRTAHSRALVQCSDDR